MLYPSKGAEAQYLIKHRRFRLKKRIFAILSVLMLVCVEYGMADIGEDLFIAVGSGDVEAVIKLLEAGAEIDRMYYFPRNNAGRKSTPLWRAVYGQHFEIVEVLIEAGADVNKHAILGGTPWGPLIASIGALDLTISGTLGTSKLLMEAGADVNVPEATGRTVLSLAAQAGLAEVVRILVIDFGMDVNARDEVGGTALMLASEKGATDVVKILLAAGADVKATDKLMRSALSMAQRKRKKDVVEILLEAGAGK